MDSGGAPASVATARVGPPSVAVAARCALAVLANTIATDAAATRIVLELNMEFSLGSDRNCAHDVALRSAAYVIEWEQVTSVTAERPVDAAGERRPIAPTTNSAHSTAVSVMLTRYRTA